MDGSAPHPSAEAAVRALLDRWRKAVIAKDLEAILSCYTPDVLAFDAIMELRFQGREAYGEHWKTCFDMMPGTMVFELRDIGIEAGADTAFGHYLCRCGFETPDGGGDAGTIRVTFGCRKVEGRWLVAHEHFSVPFDCESGKALTHLEP